MPGMLGFLVAQVEAATKEKDPTFDFKKNLIGNLGDDILSYQKAPQGTSLEDLSSAPSVTLLASPNPEQLLQGLKSVVPCWRAVRAARNFKEREFLGRKIHSFPLPALPMGEEAKPSSRTCTSRRAAVTSLFRPMRD